MERELDWIVMESIEKDRNRRYETANSLLTDIGCFLDGEPVSAGAPTPWYLFSKFAKRHKTAIAIALATITSLALGLVVAIMFFLSARTALHLAEDQNYASDMQLAAATLERSGATQTLTLLQKNIPSEDNGVDRRGWMWRHSTRKIGQFTRVHFGRCGRRNRTVRYRT